MSAVLEKTKVKSVTKEKTVTCDEAYRNYQNKKKVEKMFNSSMKIEIELPEEKIETIEIKESEPIVEEIKEEEPKPKLVFCKYCGEMVKRHGCPLNGFDND